MFLNRFSSFQIGSGVCVLAVIITCLIVGQLKYTFMIEYGVEILNIKGSSFHYNLWGGLAKLWAEELYFLYFFLFTFSGIWPFVKLLLLTMCVVYPFVNTRRMKLLSWIATFGIWSFADVWVLW